MILLNRKQSNLDISLNKCIQPQSAKARLCSCRIVAKPKFISRNKKVSIYAYFMMPFLMIVYFAKFQCLCSIMLCTMTVTDIIQKYKNQSNICYIQQIIQDLQLRMTDPNTTLSNPFFYTPRLTNFHSLIQLKNQSQRQSPEKRKLFDAIIEGQMDNKKDENVLEEVIEWFRDRGVEIGNPEDIIHHFQDSQKQNVYSAKLSTDGQPLKLNLNKSKLMLKRFNSMQVNHKQTSLGQIKQQI